MKVDHTECGCGEILSKTDIMVPNRCHIIHEDDIDLHEHYKIYAEKYEALMNANAQVVKDNISSTELYQENEKNKYIIKLMLACQYSKKVEDILCQDCREKLKEKYP